MSIAARNAGVEQIEQSLDTNAGAILAITNKNAAANWSG